MIKRLATESEIILLHKGYVSVVESESESVGFTVTPDTLQEFTKNTIISIIEISPTFKVASVFFLCKNSKEDYYTRWGEIWEIYEINGNSTVECVTDQDISFDSTKPNSFSETTPGTDHALNPK